ncbi:bolA-like protein 3 isoform X2 [Peromyscus californicus insignis]|uniref:bolA-like protein 3 isoform X2 n=1 Tax=Peromyscus californicus insignis TaxID=564181 RepID=UPI0022A6C49B|nr:bolA-like protein 3 isoform X2 [Peromyscus californicus insignis]
MAAWGPASAAPLLRGSYGTHLWLYLTHLFLLTCLLVRNLPPVLRSCVAPRTVIWDFVSLLTGWVCEDDRVLRIVQCEPLCLLVISPMLLSREHVHPQTLPLHPDAQPI